MRLCLLTDFRFRPQKDQGKRRLCRALLRGHCLFLQTHYRSAQFTLRCREQFRQLLRLPYPRRIIFHRAHSAGNVEPRASLIVHGAQNLENTHLRTPRDMRCTAGTAIHALKLDNAYGPREFFFLPVVQRRQFLGIRVISLHRNIAENGLVRRVFQCLKFRFRELHAEIQLHFPLTEMKAHVLRAVEAIGKSGQNVLSRVLLHKVKATRPIHFPLDLTSRFQGGIQNMDNHALVYLRVQELRTAECAAICLLSSLLRKKSRAVQDYSEAAFSRRRSPLLAGKNARLETKFPRIAVKNCLRHLFSPFAHGSPYGYAFVLRLMLIASVLLFPSLPKRQPPGGKLSLFSYCAALIAARSSS